MLRECSDGVGIGSVSASGRAKARSSCDLPERKDASCLGEAVHPVVRGSGSLQVLAEPTRGRVTAD